MKKLFKIVLIMLVSLSLVACGNSDSDKDGEGRKEKILFFTAFIGDFGLSDMGHRAVQEIAEKHDMEFTLVEYGSYDAGLAVNSFWDALESTDYDYFFGPTWYIEDLLNDAASQYPDTDFILYDTGRDIELVGDNIYGISFAQNESAFMAAILQSLMTKKGKIGVISTDSPILNDFSTGWITGAKYARDEMGLDVTYIHSYLADASMAGTYEAMNVLYDNGADAVWPITAQFMLAGAQAAEERGGIENGYFVMGADYDQYSYFKGLSEDGESSAVGYENIITSITKNIGTAAMKIVDSIRGEGDKIETGNRLWGVYEGGVGVLENENYLANVPEDVRNQINEIINEIGAGNIKVPSYFDFDSYEAFAAYRDNPNAVFQP